MTAAILTDLIEGKYSYCRLCFASAGDDAFRLQDEVFINFHSKPTEEIAKILECVLGENCTKDMTPLDAFCSKCIKSARDSYNFITKCQKNSEQLYHSVNSLFDCLENTCNDLDSYKSLFIHVKNTEDFSSKQYYDNQLPIMNKSSALTRFNSLVFRKYGRSNSNKKVCKTRIQNSEELTKICEIIRDGNHSEFKCNVCSAIFKKSFNLKKHYYSQHSEKHLKCTECHKNYGSEALLKQHKYDCHASIMCSECGKTYKNRYSLLYHVRQHSGESPYECSYCGMKFQWSSRRAEHIRRYHLEPSIECDICHVKFRSLGSLYNHRNRHFNPNSRLHVTQETPPVAEEIVTT